MLAMSVLSTAPVAAQGTLVSHFGISNFTVSPVYWPIGITFDGKNLWYSQPSSNTSGIFQVTTTGKLLRNLSLVFPTGNGALAWDGANLWVGSFGGGSTPVSQEPFVFQVSTAGGGTVVKSLNLTSIFAVDGECDVIDGLAFDPSTGTLWVSPDVGCLPFPNTCSEGFAYNIDTNGNLIRKIQFGFGVSGVAVANGNLYVVDRCDPTHGTRGFSLIDKVDMNGNVLSSFPITQLGENSWAESITFDPTTFSTCVIWAMQPYHTEAKFTNSGSFHHAEAAAYSIPCT